MPRLLLRGLHLGTVDAILFDKDGTISHSEPMLNALAQSRIAHCLELARLQNCDPEKHQTLNSLLQQAYGVTDAGIHPAGALAVGSHDQNLVSTATALAQTGFGWADALAIAQEVFSSNPCRARSRSASAPQPTAGIQDFLKQMTTVGMMSAVISNDHMQGIREFIAANGLEKHFQAHWSAQHRPSKPDPEAVLALCRELRVPPSRCALIGDANSDLRMARTAGVAVVLGYLGGWSLPVDLDPSFQHLDHWQEIQVVR